LPRTKVTGVMGGTTPIGLGKASQSSHDLSPLWTSPVVNYDADHRAG
jgi:hypothetical protein